MNALRVVLVGLAVVVFVALGWRLSSVRRAPVQEAADTVPVIHAPPPIPQPAPESQPAPSPEPTPPPTANTPAAPAPAAPTPAAPAPVAPAPVTPEASAPAAPAPVAPEASVPAAATATNPDDARQRIETSLKTAPILADAFDVLKANFPAVADQALADALDTLRKSGQTPSADDVFGNAVRDLRQTYGVLAAKAGPASLAAIFDTQSATLSDLAQTDPRICADYLYGGTSPEYADFAAGHRLLISQAALATIHAITEGRSVQNNRAAPTPNDFKALQDGLAAKGLSPDEISALLDGKSVDPPLPDARLCANARSELDVLHDLPTEVRDRLYGLEAELLART